MPVWAIFGQFDLEQMEVQLPYFAWVVWLYILASNICLLNLLIASFTSTYNRVRDNAMQEFRYEQYMRLPVLIILHYHPPSGTNSTCASTCPHKLT